MNGLTADRIAEVERILARVATWAGDQTHVRAIAVVGSWARRAASMASDLDLVIIGDHPTQFVDHEGWWSFVEDASLIRTQAWGSVTERRLRLPSGLELDIAVAPVAWACIPVDAGTRRVLAHGATRLYDPAGILQGAIAALTGDERSRG